MGLGSLLARDAVNITVTTTNEAGLVLGSDVFTVTDGLMPSWASTPYRGAMNLPGAWRAAIIAADLLGSLPWEAYIRSAGNVPVLAPDQPALLTQPAPPDPLVTTVSSWGLDYIWHGNAVSVKADPDEFGDVSLVAPVPIGNVAIAWASGRSDELDRRGRAFRRGERVYRIGNVLYHADEVVHLKGPCEPGALRGLGALEVHLSGAIRTGLELQRQAGNLDITGVPTGTLKITAPDMTKEEAAQAKSAWLSAQRDRTVAVLNDVTEFEPLAWNPTEAQLLDARKFSLHEIALIVGVPLYFLGVETSNRTYSNVEQEGIVLTRFHLAGAIRRVEWGFTSCMRPGRFVQADLSDALRADTLTRYQAWQIGAVAGFLTPNEIRERENLKPMPGGDTLAVPVTPDANPANPADGPDVGNPEIADGSKQQGRSAAGEFVPGLPVEPMAAMEFAVVLDHWLELEGRAKGSAGPTGTNLHEYWTKGAGRAKWDTWTELYRHLLKYLSPERAKRTAAQWFHDVKGFWPGDRKNK
jgi:phage portal protein BeeE